MEQVTVKCGTEISQSSSDKQVTSELTQGRIIANSGAAVSARADSTLVPPPIPKKSPRVRAFSMPTTATFLPPLPPRTKPVETSSRQNLPLPIQPLLSDKPTASVSIAPAHTDTTSCSTMEQVVTEVTTLKAISERPDDLPAIVRLIDGHYGHTSRFTVSAGDCFQINFLKHTRVLHMQDLAGREYSVPLTSAMKIGLLSESMNPTTISSILTMTKPPYVVCAQNDGEDKKGKVKVGKGDLLILKERKRKALQCHNLTTGSNILLHKGFDGMFNLDPKLTPLEIVSHLPDVFPCKAKLYSALTIADNVHEGPEKIVTLKGCSVDASLAATELQPNSMERGDLVYIPLDRNLAKLRVEILAVENKEHLYDDAHDLMQAFDPLHGDPSNSVEGTNAAVDTQSSYLPKACPDQMKVGKELPMDKKSSSKEHTESDKCLEPCSSDGEVEQYANDKSVTTQTGNTKNHAQHTKNAYTTAAFTPQGIPPNTVESVSDSDEYTLIPDISLSKKATRPLVKPRMSSRLKSSSVCSPSPLPAKPSTTPGPVEPASDDQYTTIPEIQLRIGRHTGPPPTAKPRRQPGTSHSRAHSPVTSRPLPPPKPSSIVPATQECSDKPCPSLSPKPEHMSEYVALQLYSHDSSSTEHHSTIKPTLLPCTEPPSVVPRHKPLLAADQSKKNKEFLMSMNPAQVSM